MGGLILRALAAALLLLPPLAGAQPAEPAALPPAAQVPAEAPAGQAPAAPAPGIALHVTIDGAIGPATSAHVLKALDHAAMNQARVVILQMDTPGGLDSSMRDIIKGILSSPVPVIAWVAPSGSRAASAGTYILYASHVAAMAPATNLGAATPVQIGGSPSPSPAPEKPATDGKGDSPEAGEQPGSAMERKAVNDAVAYIRGLAVLRGRNADWAEQAVRTAASLDADKALASHVIDVVAAEIPALLAQVNGRPVQVGESTVTLDTADITVETFETDWRTELLATITDPNVAYLLMLVGIYGLIFEGYNPGAFVPGIVGAICLLLALFAFQVLSVNYAGLALIGLGIVLIIAEAFVPSFGALGLGGIVAFVIGSVILMDESSPGVQISRALIGGVALAASLTLLAMMVALVRIRHRPVVSGQEGMIGQLGEALDDFTGQGTMQGTVFVHGERWKARSPRPVVRGQTVRVRGIHGLVLDIEPVDPDRY